jgi:hypothetical protein
LLIERDVTMDEQLKKIGIITLLVGAALAAQADERWPNRINHGKSHVLVDQEPMKWNGLELARQNRRAFSHDEDVAERRRFIRRIAEKFSDCDKDCGLEPPPCISPH